MRVLLCGGGTAGHVNPALAIAQTIKRNIPYSEFAYVVTPNGIENKLVEFRKFEIQAQGLKRSLSLSNIKTAFLTIKAIKKSKEIIKEFRPNVIIGTGGYACYPVLYAGGKMGIKTVIHESNAVPGKTTKMLQKHVDKVLLNFDETKKHFKRKDNLIYTGNPLREGFGALNKEETREKHGIENKYVILAYGGSLGATAINESMIELIENLIKDNKSIYLVWATGKRDYEKMFYLMREKGYDKLKNIKLYDYIYDMPEKIAMADIVICRSGAMTVSEMAISGKCAIFIPSPNVTDNHQYKNAKLLDEKNAAILVPEERIYELVDVVKDLIFDDNKIKGYENRILNFANKNSNKQIYEEIIRLVKSK